MTIRFSKPFVRQYTKLPASVRKKVDQQLRRLAENMHHPSLSARKMTNQGDILGSARRLPLSRYLSDGPRPDYSAPYRQARDLSKALNGNELTYDRGAPQFFENHR